MRRLLNKIYVVCLLSVITTTAQAKWFTWDLDLPVRKLIREDIRDRLDIHGQGQVRDLSESVIYCHEACHMVNAQVSNMIGWKQRHSFYMGRNRICSLSIPRVRLSKVSEYVQPSMRHKTLYKTYFLEAQRDWDQDALYILDEQHAYITELQCAREEHLDPLGADKYTEIFCHYADCVVQAVKDHDPQYSELHDLETFVRQQRQRAAHLLSGSSHD